MEVTTSPEEVRRITPEDAHDLARRGEALLVCAYEDEARCQGLALEGSITLQQLMRALPKLPMSQEIVFYCA
ncbi:MAG TPA: hypothetical protein VGK67_11730 [Myxococcales bacterium]|jgi:hypothetical protein